MSNTRDALKQAIEWLEWYGALRVEDFEGTRPNESLIEYDFSESAAPPKPAHTLDLPRLHNAAAEQGELRDGLREAVGWLEWYTKWCVEVPAEAVIRDMPRTYFERRPLCLSALRKLAGLEEEG